MPLLHKLRESQFPQGGEVLSSLLRIPRIRSTDVAAVGVSDRCVAIPTDTGAHAMPLIFPCAILRDRPLAIHMFDVRLSWQEMTRFEAAVTDHKPAAAGRYRTLYLIDHGSACCRSYRSRIPYPEFRLDTVAGICSAATLFIFKFRNNEVRFGSLLDGEEKNGTVVGLVSLLNRFLVIGAKI